MAMLSFDLKQHIDTPYWCYSAKRSCILIVLIIKLFCANELFSMRNFCLEKLGVLFLGGKINAGLKIL